MWQETVYFPNSRGERLSGVLHYPDESARLLILILGPHPHLGGDMENNVVAKIAERMESLSPVMLRFDYHGNGQSQSRIPEERLFDYYEGLEQAKDVAPFVEDALAALACLRECAAGSDAPLALVGYSFGAYLALLLRERVPCRRLIAVAPPLARYAPIADAGGAVCLAAEKDFLEAGHVPPGLVVERLPGADHFFRGMEEEVADWAVRKWEETT